MVTIHLGPFQVQEFSPSHSGVESHGNNRPQEIFAMREKCLNLVRHEIPYTSACTFEKFNFLRRILFHLPAFNCLSKRMFENREPPVDRSRIQGFLSHALNYFNLPCGKILNILSLEFCIKELQNGNVTDIGGELLVCLTPFEISFGDDT